jgi:hypothetical protein
MVPGMTSCAPRSLVLVGVLAASVVACTGYFSTAAAARDQFVGDATCPAERVTVVHAPAQPAPPDVAADPSRLEVWKAEAAKSPTYVARGCGQERRYLCLAHGDYPYQYNCMQQ